MNTHDPYQALRSSEFVRYLLSHYLDIFGLQMLITAVGWELYERTSSAFVLGLVGLMQFLPILLFSLPIGHIVDTRERKMILLLAQAFMIVAAIGLAAVSLFQGSLFIAYGCLSLIGLASAMSMPARAAFFPQLLTSSSLPNAVTWNNSVRQIASVLGPVFGGLTIAVSGNAQWAYFGYILCSIIFIVLIASIQTRTSEHVHQPWSLVSLFAGIRFILSTKLILATITLDLFAVLFGGATALLPLFARDILHIGPVGLGWLRTAPAIGAIVMSLSIAYRPPMRRAGITMLFAVSGYGLSMIIFGLSVNPYLSFFMLLLGGALDTISVIVRHTLLQVLTPPAMLGRVYAVNTLFGISSNELGGFESGTTAQLFGPIASVVGGGVASILIVILSVLLWPEVATLKSIQRSKDTTDNPLNIKI